jgi:hypothetical protein
VSETLKILLLNRVTMITAKTDPANVNVASESLQTQPAKTCRKSRKAAKKLVNTLMGEWNPRQKGPPLKDLPNNEAQGNLPNVGPCLIKMRDENARNLGDIFQVFTDPISTDATPTRVKGPNNHTKENLEMARIESQRHLDLEPNDEEIWRGSRDKDFLPSTCLFLWLSLHDTYMLGTKWFNSSSAVMIDRAMCQVCDTIEDMQHLLFQCTSPGQSQIWNLTRLTWTETGGHWTRPNLGLVFASPWVPPPPHNLVMLLK